MNLNDLLLENGLDPATTRVMRHRPKEQQFREKMTWLAGEDPETFNAYQQTHGPREEGKLQLATHVASFIGDRPNRALFAGIYALKGFKRTTRPQRQKHRGQRELSKYGVIDGAGTRLWFDLSLTKLLEHWRGKLVIRWNNERAWARWAEPNTFEVQIVYEESQFSPPMPDWRELVFDWNGLGIMPTSWRSALREWRGIYYIFDVSDAKGYVGAAYGKENILGRWTNYSKTGHGNNKLLRRRKPENLRFTILERMGPDAPKELVCECEKFWKERLHTRKYGLNEN
jgi:hypothetical protein